jgi:putative lipoprotein
MEELEGTAWTLTYFESDVGTILALAESPATLEFAASDSQSGRLAGTSGCNRYTAGCAVSGTGLTVTQMLSTRMLCTPAERMEQEYRFFQAMQVAKSYLLQDDSLVIKHVSGTLHFKRAEATSDSGQPHAL